MKEGFHFDVPAAEYHADPCIEPSLSSSIAAIIASQSPAHAQLAHPRLNPGKVAVEESSTLSFGSVVHELLLKRGSGFAVWHGDTWRGGEAQAFKTLAQTSGMIPIKKADLDRATAVAENARAQMEKMGLGYVFGGGESEVVAIWKDRGCYMRAMFDKWHEDRGEIWDVKTISTGAHPENISRQIAKFNYDLRSEFYLMGAEKITGKPSSHALGFCFLFVEVEPPFCVVPCFLDSSYKARGWKRANDAIETWSRCMETGVWPGYTSSILEIAAPGWVDFEIEEEGISSSTGGRVI